MQNYNPPPKPKKNPKPINTDSFLEALRSLGSNATSGATDMAKDFTSEAWNQISGYPSTPSQDTFPPDLPGLPFPPLPRNKNRLFPSENENRYRRQAFFERQKSVHEKTVFSKADEQTKKQIASLQEEIKRLAASTQNLAREAQVAAFQPVVNPGTYHMSFFEKLKNLVREIRKRVDQSASWLATMNSKSKKKQGHYWSQVQKSGTKYMLSQERYMQTSAG